MHALSSAARTCMHVDATTITCNAHARMYNCRSRPAHLSRRPRTSPNHERDAMSSVRACHVLTAFEHCEAAKKTRAPKRKMEDGAKKAFAQTRTHVRADTSASLMLFVRAMWHDSARV